MLKATHHVVTRTAAGTHTGRLHIRRGNVTLCGLQPHRRAADRDYRRLACSKCQDVRTRMNRQEKGE